MSNIEYKTQSNIQIFNLIYISKIKLKPTFKFIKSQKTTIMFNQTFKFYFLELNQAYTF